MIDLRSLKSEFAPGSGPNRVYSEIRYQDNRETRIDLTNGSLETNFQESVRGVSARSFSCGYWGFSAYSNPSKDAAIAALREATRNAKFLAGRSEKSNAGIAYPTAMQFKKSYASTKTPISPAIWIELLKALDNYIVKKYPDLRGRRLSLWSLEIEKQLATSDGSEIHTTVPRAFFQVSMTKDSKTGPVSFLDTRGGLGDLQDFFLDTPQSFESWIDEIYDMVSRKADGVKPTSGVYDVVLAPDLAALLMHEAVGHGVEADLVQAGSVLWDRLNQMVANPLVTYVDIAHTYDGAPAPRPVHVDDEGVEASDTVIIQKGVLKSFLNNRETALHFEQKPTGHARAFQYCDEPLIRMRNTALLPGTTRIEQMIASIEDGYYFMKPGRAQADTTGEFLMQVGTGFEIKGGKIGRVLRDSAITGFALEFMNSISMVGDEFHWDTSGYSCLKKQLMPVGLGSPALKCKVRVSGG